MTLDRNEKLKVIGAMKSRGGSFVRALGDAWLHADADNSQRIETAFPEYIATYTKIAHELPDRDQAEAAA